jgi:hypothetical protein
MDLLETLIKIIGSKWFVLALGIGMAFVIPTCYSSVKLYPTPIGIITLLMACITTGLSFYKFGNMTLAQIKKPAQESQAW